MQSPNGSTFTTSPKDFSKCTAAAHCMIAVWSEYLTAALRPNPISDSEGNVYALARNATQAASVGGASHPAYTTQLWVTFAPRTSSTMTFTATGSDAYMAIAVVAFNGLASGADQIAGSTYGGNAYHTQLTGSVTPTKNNELLLTCLGVVQSTGYSLTSDSPFTPLDNIDWRTGAGAGIFDAYQIQHAATRENPGWIERPDKGFSGGSLIATFYSVASPAALSVSGTAIPEGFKGASYKYQLQASGGITPYTWSQTSGTLPRGLHLSSEGLVNGTPSQTILNAAQTFKVMDSNGSTAFSSGLTFTIAAAPLSVTTSSCPNGVQYSSYAGCTVAASGGTGPYTFSLGNFPYAALPEGLSFNTSTGIISSSLIGAQGAYNVQFIVKDAENATATRTITFGFQGRNAFLSSIFPNDSIFHHRVDAVTTGLPVDTSPAAPIPTPYLSAKIRVFFGPSTVANMPNGIPAIEVPQNQPFAPVGAVNRSGTQYFRSAPIPAYAPVEGTLNSVENSGNDMHVLVFLEADPGHPPSLYELYGYGEFGKGGFNGSEWLNTYQGYWPDANTNVLARQGHGSADAAGLPVGPLLVNADEVIGTGTPTSPNGTVRHPIRFTMPHGANYWVWPATATAGVGKCDNGGRTIPIGTQISESSPPTSCTESGVFGEIYRLKASVATPSCASTSPQAAIIITAFRNYGIIMADNGLGLGLIGTPDTRWNSADLACLSKITASDFEPVNVSSLIVSNDSGEVRQNLVRPR